MYNSNEFQLTGPVTSCRWPRI